MQVAIHAVVSAIIFHSMGGGMVSIMSSYSVVAENRRRRRGRELKTLIIFVKRVVNGWESFLHFI